MKIGHWKLVNNCTKARAGKVRSSQQAAIERQAQAAPHAPYQFATALWMAPTRTTCLQKIKKINIPGHATMGDKRRQDLEKADTQSNKGTHVGRQGETRPRKGRHTIQHQGGHLKKVLRTRSSKLFGE